MTTKISADRHRTLTEGLECEPLLGVPLSLVLLALATFLIGQAQGEADGEQTRFWMTTCTLFVAGHCAFMGFYDSPRRRAARRARGCRHIAPRR